MLSRETLLQISGLIARIYKQKDFEKLRKEIMGTTKNMIPCASVTFFLSDLSVGLSCTSPLCIGEFPQEGMYDYIENYQDKDHSQWLFKDGKSHIYRECDYFTEDALNASVYYNEVYKPYRIKDTLQVAIAKNNRYLGIITFFRKEEDKDFSDDEMFIMELLLGHLENRLFHELVEIGEQKEPVVDSAGKNVVDEDEKCIEEYALTRREKEIYKLMMAGRSVEEIAKTLFVSENTIRKHIQNIYHKMGVHSRHELLKLNK